MLKIIKNGETLATVNAPTWVRLQENGCFAISNEKDANGIVVDGTVYHVLGKPDLEGHESVILSEITETEYQREQKADQDARQLQNDTAVAELSILLATLMGAN